MLNHLAIFFNFRLFVFDTIGVRFRQQKIGSDYSVRRLLTGFISAALIA